MLYYFTQKRWGMSIIIIVVVVVIVVVKIATGTKSEVDPFHLD